MVPDRRRTLATDASAREFELTGGPYAATAARLALTDLENRLDPVLASDLRLLVTEAVNNSVEHAGVGEDDSIGLKVALQPDCVRVEVRDSGPHFEPDPQPPSIDRAPGLEEDEIPGFGLFLVDQLADRWGVNREGGNCVWFELDFGQAAA
jgi:anti-sigma regulatory factor (Ser/Thr protein kinase)